MGNTCGGARVPLTAKQVQHIKPARARQEIPAGPPKGLYLVVHPTGAKSWAFRYRWLGKPSKLTLAKRYPDMSLAQARAEAEAAAEKLKQGINPSADYAEENKKPNAAETVLEEWLARAVRPSADGTVRVRTWAEIERVANKEILPICKGKTVSQVHRADILRRLDGIVDRGAPIAANETLSIIKRWLRWCVERGYIEVSPATAIKPPAERKSRDRVLADDELAAVWGASGKLEYPGGPFLRVLILTAQRRGEVAGMRWPDVDLGKALWTLPAEQTKPGRVHDVPLPPAAVEILRGLLRFTGPHVFSTRSGKIPIGGFSKLKAGLDAEIARQSKQKPLPFTLHDLRRTAATWMAGAGVPPHVLAALLNHSPGTAMGVTAIYNRFRYVEERREALERWAKHVVALKKKAALQVTA